MMITLTGNVEPPDPGLSYGLNDKSFAVALHLELRSLSVDFLELVEFLLFDRKTLVDILLLGAVGSGLSGIVS